MAQVFQMAVEVRELPVPAGTPMGGYGWGDPRPANGTMANKLKVRCVMITPASGPRIALAQVDVISIPRPVYLDILGKVLTANVVINPACFVLSQSHTHSGPMVGAKPDPYVLLGDKDAAEDTRRYTEDFVTFVADTIIAAARKATTAVTLGYAEGFAEIGRNRLFLSWTPREVPVLVARRADNYDLFAVLAGHTCHPICGPRMGLTSDADYCGFAVDEVEKRLGLGVPVVFFQGAAGDIDPMNSQQGAPDQGPALTTWAATRLANAIVATVRNAAYFPVSGPISVGIETVRLKYSVDLDDKTDRDELQRKYQERYDAGDGEWTTGAGYRHAERMLDELKGPIPNYMPMTIQKIDLGGLTILTMSHEVLSGWSVGTKNHWGRNRSTPLWVMGYANHIDCYVPAFDVLSKGNSGEAGWDGGDPKMVAAGTYTNSYSMIAPLNAGATVQDPDGVEATLVPKINALLGLPAQ